MAGRHECGDRILFRIHYLTQGKHVDGTMYSCTSLGVKIGGGIGTAVVGWLFEFSGYVGTHCSATVRVEYDAVYVPVAAINL